MPSQLTSVDVGCISVRGRERANLVRRRMRQCQASEQYVIPCSDPDMTNELFQDARQRIESAMDSHGQFMRESERFVYEYVKGMLIGFKEGGKFVIQLRKPSDSYMRGRPQVLAAEILESTRSALDYAVFALSARNNPEMNPKHPRFVIANDKEEFDAQAKLALKHLDENEQLFVEAVQPFSINNNLLLLIRDAANRVKHRNLLTIQNNSDLEVVFARLARKQMYKGWWCYPQDRETAIFARGDLRVLMLGKYDAVGLLEDMIDSSMKILSAFEQYLSTGAFPQVEPN